MAMIESEHTAIKPRTVKVLMFTVTEALASSLFNWSQVVLAIGAAAVLIGTIGAFAMGFAKDQFANERISANETETARAKEAAAVANQKAESERVERLKLEVRLAPRTLTGPSAIAMARTLSASGAVKGIPIDIISFEAMGADVPGLSQQIAAVLRNAGSPAANVLTPMGAGLVVHGILIRAATDAPANQKAAIAPLVAALQQAGLAAGPWDEYPPNEPPAGGYMGPQGAPLAKLRILVGSKPL